MGYCASTSKKTTHGNLDELGADYDSEQNQSLATKTAGIQDAARCVSRLANPYCTSYLNPPNKMNAQSLSSRLRINLDTIYSMLIYIAVGLVQFQNLSLQLYGSEYDLTNFVFLFSLLFLLFISKQNILGYFVMTSFILLQLCIWFFFQIAPFYRLVSGLVWFGGLVAISVFSHKGRYNREFTFKLLKVSLFALSALIFLQKYVFGIERPSGFFAEPTFAGLILYSGSAMILFKIMRQYNLYKITEYKEFIFFVFIVIAGVLTKSTHVLTFLLSLILILFVIGLRIRVLLFIFGVLIPLSLVLFSLADHEHIMERLIISDDISNISTLSWLRGFDQASHVFFSSPLIGYGLGSTGFFDFESSYTESLRAVGLEWLNLNEAYSALFRLIIEIGAVGVLFILYLMFVQVLGIKSRNKAFRVNSMTNSYCDYLALFGLSLLIGILIKEPTYSRSYVYLAVFLTASNWFGKSKLLNLKF